MTSITIFRWRWLRIRRLAMSFQVQVGYGSFAGEQSLARTTERRVRELRERSAHLEAAAAELAEDRLRENADSAGIMGRGHIERESHLW